MEDNVWQPKIRGWWNIDVEVYKIVYEAANKRLEDLISETVAITDKAQKVLIFNLGLASFFITLVASKPMFNWILIAFTVLATISFIISVISLYNLLTCHDIYRIGLSPDKSFRDDLDSLDSKEGMQDGNIDHQLQLTYYNAVCIIQNNVDKQRQLNTERVLGLDKVILFSAIFLIITSICLALALRVSV